MNIFQSRIDPIQARSIELCQKIRSFENKLGVKNPSTIQITSSNVQANADAIKAAVVIPSWFLLKFDDVPEHLHLTDINDPRLNEENFLNEMNRWIQDKFKELDLSQICNPMDKENLKLLILFLRDRKGYEQAKDFALAHEIAHLSHGGAKTLQILQTIDILTKKHLRDISILSVGLVIALAPFLPWASIGLGLGISATIATSHFFRRSYLYPWSCLEEKKADLDAKKILGTSSGGVYFCESIRLNNLFIREENFKSIPTIDKIIDKHGNSLVDPTYPLLTDRIAYLQH